MSDCSRPNIVLVTVDSLRADHCSFMGYEKGTTPTLDEMAEKGVMFENAIAPGPSTPESMPVILTGEWPVERENNSGSELVRRRERIKSHMEARDTVPEKMKRMGYETAAFTPNPFTSHHFGFNQGFEHFEDFMDESHRGELYQKIFSGFLNGNNKASLIRALLNFWAREEVFKPWESYYGDIVDWVNTAEEPYFLWVFLMDVHNPYVAPSRFKSQSRWKQFHANFEFWRQSHDTAFSDSVHDRLVTAYDDAIRYVDTFLAQLRTDLSDDAVIVVHGDHGEAFGEHGTYGHEPYLYDENVRVPLVVDGLRGNDISSPFSLQGFSDLLTRIVSESPDLSPKRPAVSYTRDGDALSVRTSDNAYQLSILNGGEVSKPSAIPESVNKLAQHLQADATERRVVSSTANRVVEGETL